MEVTTYDPMVRVLKRCCGGYYIVYVARCYNLRPDGEGTETIDHAVPTHLIGFVTTYDPMVRVLKR